jgi:flagellar biosynthesis/type III secretory pathway chaperone
MKDQAGQLQALLQAELGTLRTLKTSLEAEHKALLASDVALLESATAEKNVAVQAHRRQQEQRLSWMNALGISIDSTLADIVSQCGNLPAAAALQAELAALAADCHDSNRLNGGLIIRLQERARGALDVLRRDDSGPDLYSLSGAREHHSDSRTLGKA